MARRPVESTGRVILSSGHKFRRELNSISKRENDRETFARTYGAMSDGELAELAREGAELRDGARDALRHEIERRGLEVKVREQSEAVERKWRRPVTLRVFMQLQEGLLAKSILESAGVRCFLADENIARLDGIMSIVGGGLKLWVDEQDAEAAAALLDQEMPEQKQAKAATEERQRLCPRCRSSSVSVGTRERAAAPSGLLAKLGALWKRRLWTCQTCAHEWRDAG